MTARHPGRCPACKLAVERLLGETFGSVRAAWATGWPCRLDDLNEHAAAPLLSSIHEALVAHRGHSVFVRAKKLPSCDYYVHGKPGFIVEYDESQHFTAPRARVLSLIPATHPLAFDLSRWTLLAQEMNAKDNDPPYRDEQRAWYDVLRDVLPIEHGLGPTSRLLDREVAYCELNPRSPADIATFKRMLGRP